MALTSIKTFFTKAILTVFIFVVLSCLYSEKIFAAAASSPGQNDAQRELRVWAGRNGLITASMPKHSMENLLNLFKQIPEEQRADFALYARRLINNNVEDNDAIMVRIISGLFLVSPNERDFFSVQVQRFFRQGDIKDASLRMEIVESFYKKVDRIENDIDQALRLITPDMNEEDRASVVFGLSRVRLGDRALFEAQVRRLFIDGISGYVRARIILNLSLVRQNLEAIVDQLLRLISADMPDEGVLNIITAFRRLSPENRVQVVDRSLQALAEGAAAGQELEGEDRTNRLLQLLELPLDAPIPPLHEEMADIAAGAGGTAAGINVHALGRDSRTAAALQQLFKETTEAGFSKDNVDALVLDFKNYLTSYSDENVSRSAQITLGLLQPDNPNSFGPLLGTPVTFGNLDTTGEEILARFWWYASNYHDMRASSQKKAAKEQENAKHALVNGLARAIAEDGHRVCLPGMLQRLVIAILQGRMEGVNVEREDIGFDTCPVPPLPGAASGGGGGSASTEDRPQVDSGVALRMFFENQENQTITAAEALRTRGNAWLEENPNVNREEFLKLLNDYIYMQGFPQE